MKTTKLFLTALFLIFSIFAFSQDGTLDTSFGENGIVEMDFYGFKDFSFSIAQQSNGKIISAGQIEIEYDIYQSSLIRFNTDGSLDTTFGDNGIILVDLGQGYNFYTSIFALDNNDLIVGGTVGNWGEKDFIISEFLTNGDVDNDFGVNGNVTIDFLGDDDVLLQLIILNDEKILGMGRSKMGSEYFISLVKLLPSGGLDTAFGTNGKLTLDINEEYFNSFSASLQDDNSIIVSFSEYLNNNNRVVKIIKLFENGDLDSTFGIDGIIEILFNNVINVNSCIGVDSNNNILIITTQNIDYDEYSSTMSRYTPMGNLDTTFGVNGFYNFATSFYPQKIIVQPNTRILVGGGIPEFEGSHFILRRLFNNGTIDGTFNGNAYGYFQNSGFILQDDGKILATGNTYWYDGPEDLVLVRYNNDPLRIEDQQVQELIVFPNPSNGIFKITHNFISSETLYQITDIIGKLIQTGKLSGEQTEIDLSLVQRGVYLLNASGSTFRLIKN